jgi:hypothetical protein
MTKQTYTTRASYAFSALLFATACGLSACGTEDDNGNGIYVPPGNGGLMQDASAAVTGDAGTTPIVQTTPDAGGVTPVTQLDSGTKPVVTGDASTVVPTGDSGVVATGDGGATPDGGGTVTMRADQGMGDGKDVICIGDSWMNLDNTVGIQESLLKVSKRPYRTFGVPGTLLLDEAIPKQYEMAKMQGAAKTVIMTAGGNDVLQDPVLLLTDCPDDTFDDACKKRIDDVSARLQKLWNEMAMDGVTDVLIISYSNKTLSGGYKKVSAYSTEKIAPICNAVPAPLRCSTFDTDMNVDFKDRGDSIHPDNPTYDALGAGVWKMMQDKGMRR